MKLNKVRKIAGQTGEELNPHEDEDVNDILGSIEADYDDGKAI